MYGTSCPSALKTSRLASSCCAIQIVTSTHQEKEELSRHQKMNEWSQCTSSGKQGENWTKTIFAKCGLIFIFKMLLKEYVVVRTNIWEASIEVQKKHDNNNKSYFRSIFGILVKSGIHFLHSCHKVNLLLLYRLQFAHQRNINHTWFRSLAKREGSNWLHILDVRGLGKEKKRERYDVAISVGYTWHLSPLPWVFDVFMILYPKKSTNTRNFENQKVLITIR